jgi:hypothetical protein
MTAALLPGTPEHDAAWSRLSTNHATVDSDEVRARAGGLPRPWPALFSITVIYSY